MKKEELAEIFRIDRISKLNIDNKIKKSIKKRLNKAFKNNKKKKVGVKN